MRVFDIKTNQLITDKYTLNSYVQRTAVRTGGIVEGIRTDTSTELSNLIGITFKNCKFFAVTFEDICNCTFDDDCKFIDCTIRGDNFSVTSNCPFWKSINANLEKLREEGKLIKQKAESLKNKTVYKFAKAVVVVELECPDDAKIIPMPDQNKNKTNKAIVKDIKLVRCHSGFDSYFIYEKGKTVSSFLDTDNKTCGKGIYFCESINQLNKYDQSYTEELKALYGSDEIKA